MSGGSYRSKEKIAAGQLLRQLRERACPLISRVDLGNALGVSGATISHWESGLTVINAGLLLRIRDVLDLGPKEYQELVLARLPAFNKKWLDDYQPENERGGLLLRACRERFGFSLSTLSRMIGLTHHVSLSNWENGHFIPSNYFNQLVAEFYKANKTLSPDDVWFDDKIEKRLRDICPLKMKIDSVNLGATQQTKPGLSSPEGNTLSKG